MKRRGQSVGRRSQGPAPSATSFSKSFSNAGFNLGTSWDTVFQTISVSIAKYPCTKMFRMPMILCHSTSGANARTSSGKVLAASPMI